VLFEVSNVSSNDTLTIFIDGAVGGNRRGNGGGCCCGRKYGCTVEEVCDSCFGHTTNIMLAIILTINNNRQVLFDDRCVDIDKWERVVVNVPTFEYLLASKLILPTPNNDPNKRVSTSLINTIDA
tara:strand:- start:2800 stop:3174 length:375 start_codon:yes stop_codon:yes gene_type:complete